MTWEHKPGSDDAIVNGCTCPVMDNHHGQGRNGNFITHSDCPLHGVHVVDDRQNPMLGFVIICAGFTLATIFAWLIW